jgi:hypothetical protein
MADGHAKPHACERTQAPTNWPPMADPLGRPWERTHGPVATHGSPTDPDAEEVCVVCRGHRPAQPTPANRGLGGPVGHAIGAAASRALERERQSPHKIEVRFSITHECCRQELTIMAGQADSANQTTTVVRQIAMAELEDRAHELPGLVDDAISELEAQLCRGS